ncbi:hypothetical protein CTEN210_09710 [Chaetoceros tenuissimus]|uniref:G-protein coupled receptors family 1 profile domain-containing protein n=1 Tax=Chaetoceros tenuissimus TaxID=426638 RepID=A0AAD3CZ51_9STRA|nr:hypothetical protein CTEN210_09710 [Chaetoceros tenuissimus]
MEEKSPDHDRIAFSKTGIILPAISGTISFLASCLIMITILRSKQNTNYHRIIFFMSFWDALSSFSISLTTLPMPSDTVYNYAGPSFGNKYTCQGQQAFIIITSVAMVLLSSVMLNSYYLCIMRYHVSNAKFRKYAEPIFLLLSIPLSLTAPIYLARKEMLNPTIHESFCNVDVYPHECLQDNSIECIRGDRLGIDMKFLFSIAAIVEIAILTVSMGLIVHTSCQEKILETKNVASQAFMYLFTCILTWGLAAVNTMLQQENKVIVILTFIFFPLQGFFNLLIFMFHKIYTYKTFNHVYFTMDVVKMFFVSPEQFQDQYVCGIENVERLFELRKFEELKLQKEVSPDAFFEENNISNALERTPEEKEDEDMVKSADLSVQVGAAYEPASLSEFCEEKLRKTT